MVGYVLPQNMARTLTVLLGELVRHFAAGLKAPRWVRTADGVKFIDEVAEWNGQDWHLADIGGFTQCRAGFFHVGKCAEKALAQRGTVDCGSVRFIT
ncbi:hypothetical protein RC97_13205 [Pectobacterium brasiliense]|nr:hypothetical protein RC81_07295 [Pectobacterium brasiliense]KHT17680.1 hypothetical protein RC97_13205 [Pectobacterium brasiliense]